MHFSSLSVPADGKMKVCEEHLLPILVKLLSDDEQGVVANAAGTIMNTAVITKGQHKIKFQPCIFVIYESMVYEFFCYKEESHTES